MKTKSNPFGSPLSLLLAAALILGIFASLPMTVQAASLGFSVSPTAVDFGSAVVGYTPSPTEQTVTIQHNYAPGSNSIYNPQAVLEGSDAGSFDFSYDDRSGIMLDPTVGSEVTSTIRPKQGLPVGQYSANIKITGQDGYGGSEITATVTVTFKVTSGALQPYTIVATAGAGGSISPAGNVRVNAGDDQSFTISPDSGYYIEDVLVDGNSVGRVASYSFNNVDADHTIHAAFTSIPPQPYTIVATAGAGGSISPAGNVQVNAGDDQSFAIRPDSGYYIEDVLVDGNSVGRAASYSFNNVDADRTIHAVFATAAQPGTITGGSTGTGGNGNSNTYVVRYFKNIQDDEAPFHVQGSYQKGDTATVTDRKPARAGYRFLYWMETPVDHGRHYDARDKITIHGDYNLYAQWELISETFTPDTVGNVNDNPGTGR